jgi:glycosyltransferase involved in cell wall biosynthesis
MRILFLMDQMYLHGGGERMLSQKINYLIEYYNYEIYLLTSEQKNKKSVYNLNPKLIWKDLEINYHRKLSYFHPKNILKTVVHFNKLNNEIAILKPNCIVSVSFSPEQYFLPLLHKKIPKLKEFHSSRFMYNASFIRKKIDVVFEKYDALVVLNQTEKTYYKGKKIVVIPNFTDFNYNNETIKEKTVIAAGRIAPVKQFDELIKIWKKLKLEFPDWKLKIFGDGEIDFVNNLKKMIIELDLSDNVFIFSSVNSIQYEMQKASIYAMTSSTECFPMVLLEAQACKLPIVSYDCPNGPRHIINDTIDGYLITQSDSNLFKNKLFELMKNCSLRIYLGENALRNVQNFSKNKVMSKWNDLFLDVIIK